MKRTIPGNITFILAAYLPASTQKATTENGDRMDRVIKAIRAVGGSTVAVETGGYDLSSVYRQPTRNQNEIPTIDASITGGASRIASLTFDAKKPEPARLGG